MNISGVLTLEQCQEITKKFSLDHGFDKETAPELFVLLVEEVGELAKALRKQNGQKIDKSRKQHEIEDEVADVLWLLLDLCNRLDIKLDEAFMAKHEKNSKRTWSN